MSRQLPNRSSLEHLKKQAKDLLKAHKRRKSSVCDTLRLLNRFSTASDQKILAAEVALHEAQYALAMYYEFKSWNELKTHVLEQQSKEGQKIMHKESLIVRRIFTPEVYDKLKVSQINEEDPHLLRQRMYLLRYIYGEQQEWEDEPRVTLSLWAGYLDTAMQLGFFKPEHDGEDFRRRLTSKDYGQFRGAYAECAACWLFHKHLHFKVQPKPPGKKGKVPEMLITHPEGKAYVEVKSPHHHMPKGVWLGDDSKQLKSVLAEANKQLPKGKPGIVFIFPDLRTPVIQSRNQLIRAFYYDQQIGWLVDKNTGAAVSEPYTVLKPDGKLLNTKHPNGRSIKPDGSPPHSRVSAVVVYEPPCEFFNEVDKKFEIRHKVLVLPNPNASYKIQKNIWKNCIVAQPETPDKPWSDGHSMFP